MIKWIIIPLLFLLSLDSYGQRRHTRTVFDNWARINQFNKEDSLEGLYVNDSLLNIITDTLPLYTLDENGGWRELKIIYYFYDSSNMLKKIAFRNGRAGYYYFKEASLEK